MTTNFWFEAINITCFKNGYKVIKNLNLQLSTFENVILLGPNGSGKSSLVELINRNIYPVVGKGSNLKIFNEELIYLRDLRRKISTVNNEIKYRFNPKIKVIDLIISGLHGKYCFVANKTKRDISKAEKLIKEMNIHYLSEKNFSYLSDGEKKIALIARALINDPEILILDEPTANLDYKSKFFVTDRINELSKIHTTILCITHDISIISKIYNRVIMIKDRKIIADGIQEDVINNENIRNLFDVNVEVYRNMDVWNIKRNPKR